MSSQDHRNRQQDDRRLPPISQIFNMASANPGESSLALPPMRSDGTWEMSGYPLDAMSHNPQDYHSRMRPPPSFPPGGPSFTTPDQYGQSYQSAHHSSRSRPAHPQGNYYPNMQHPVSYQHRDHQRSADPSPHSSMPYPGPGVAPAGHLQAYPSSSSMQMAYPGPSTSGDSHPVSGRVDYYGGLPSGPPSRDVGPHDGAGDDPTQPKTRYECSYCGKGFLRPSALKIHLISHTGDKDFVCPEESCRRRFGVRSNMLRHIRLVHQNLQQSVGEESDGS